MKRPSSPGTQPMLLAIGHQIRAARRSKGLSLEKAAVAAGVSRITFARYEAGDIKLFRIAIAITAAVGLALWLRCVDEAWELTPPHRTLRLPGAPWSWGLTAVRPVRAVAL